MNSTRSSHHVSLKAWCRWGWWWGRGSEGWYLESQHNPVVRIETPRISRWIGVWCAGANGKLDAEEASQKRPNLPCHPQGSYKAHEKLILRTYAIYLIYFSIIYRLLDVLLVSGVWRCNAFLKLSFSVCFPPPMTYPVFSFRLSAVVQMKHMSQGFSMQIYSFRQVLLSPFGQMIQFD